ncbi:MAG: hypothetical protein ACOZB3_12760 [Calditrichota bacterium]
MKNYVFGAMILTAVSLLLMGCQSAERKAQSLYEAGKYEEVIAQYGDNPDAAGIVEAAKQVIGDKLLAKGDYDAYLELWDTSPLADSARKRVSDELFKQQRYQEIMEKYGETPAAKRSQIILEKRQTDSLMADSLAKTASQK